ncbi:FAD-dependent oxidoreductase [Acidaminobacter sp. JC074]|uniref:oxidoreductase n=1 Tax=Acidaminobacter sp. JC074 TaxID=2530199 RepID=UPI001F111123|nr:FAD-dependent oxidoreductase [Acidaminobacter sp. JC074]
MKKKYAPVFETVNFGRLELKNRLAMSPMNPHFFEGDHDDATYTNWHVEYYKRRAKGGVGLIITGHIKAEKTLDPYPLNQCFPVMDSEERVKEMAELTESIHRYGGKIAAQLSAGSGIVCQHPLTEQWPASASANPLIFKPTEYARELTKIEIKYLVDAYGKAADRVKRSGFDALYLLAHVNTVDQFLSPCWNRRTDEYGGSLENRLRFFSECLEAARQYVGPDYPIIVGMALDHCVEGSRTIDETIDLCKEIEKMNIDGFHIRNGSYLNPIQMTPNAHYPDGMVLENVRKFRKEISKPVIIDGKFGEPDFLLETVENKEADVIGMARQFLADESYANKLRMGRLEDIRPCIRCMECYERILMQAKYIGCTVNPTLGKERDALLSKAVVSKKVLVVGGGPAGMQAAITASKRGHEVILVEKRKQLGGMLHEAAAPDYKYMIGDFNRYLQTQLEKSQVEVILNQKVDSDFVTNMSPDVVIMANGAKPIVPQLEGMEKAVLASDVLKGQVEVGDSVAVIGGGLVGTEAAYYLAKQGKQVEIVEMQSELVADVTVFNKFDIIQELTQMTVKPRLASKVSKITDQGLVIEDQSGSQTIKVDTIVVAIGYKTDNSLFDALYNEVEEVYRVGDAMKPRRIIEAMSDAYNIAKEL